MGKWVSGKIPFEREVKKANMKISSLLKTTFHYSTIALKLHACPLFHVRGGSSGLGKFIYSQNIVEIPRCLIAVFGLALFLLLSPLGPVRECRADTAADRQIYADLLKKYVKQGRVDYRGLKTEEQRLDRYLKTLEKTTSGKLSRKEAFAFYINVYNAWTVKLILTGYPGVKSIKDLGSLFKSPWKKKICRVDGALLTLDYIEHEILSPRFKDPRVHFAINCAAASCPPLCSEPYEGETLERQLNDSTQAFINDPKLNYLEGNTLYVSKIFKWFAADFNDDVVGFFIKYAQNDFKQRLEALKSKIKVKYLHYDWSLNGA